MQTYYKSFSVTGSANSTVWDDGIQATEAEKKHVVGIFLVVSDYQRNTIKVNIDREQIASFPDVMFDTDHAAAADTVRASTSKNHYIPLDVKLNLGETLQIGVTSGSTATSLEGCYVYDEG